MVDVAAQNKKLDELQRMMEERTSLEMGDGLEEVLKTFVSETPLEFVIQFCVNVDHINRGDYTDVLIGFILEAYTKEALTRLYRYDLVQEGPTNWRYSVIPNLQQEAMGIFDALLC